LNRRCTQMNADKGDRSGAALKASGFNLRSSAFICG
jgi:hypothetical protein